ncbi:MAG: IS630 family transposase [Oligoflexales bacterium]
MWYQDESRFGEKTRLKAVWRLKGSKVNAVKQTGYRSTYVFGAVNPVSGESSGLVCGECSTDVMNIHLSQISDELPADTHIILVMDNAGWHSNSKDLIIPANISILDLHPYSPQLNPIEKLWQWLKDNFFSNIVISKDEDLDNLACRIWNKLTSSIIKSVCRVNYLKKLLPLWCL